MNTRKLQWIAFKARVFFDASRLFNELGKAEIERLGKEAKRLEMKARTKRAHWIGFYE